MISKTTLLLCLTATIMCHKGFNLLDINSISQFVPAEFLPQIQAQLPAMQNIAASNPSLTSLSGGATAVPTPSVNPVPTAPVPAAAAPSVAPYSPYAAPAAAAPTVLPTPTVNSAAAMAPVQLPSPVALPAANQSNVSNPFLASTPSQVVSDPNTITLYADRNANPVFHPPFASQVPSYPPLTGQHWYQYRVA